MLRGKTQKARQGGIPIGFYNYGYIYDPKTGKVRLHETESQVIKDIFQWFAQEDIGVNGVAKRLNERGVPTRKSKKWHKQVIYQILTNPVYKGTWRYKDIYIPVPAIVDEIDWLKVQDKIKEARRLWAGQKKHDYLLSGIVTCGDCGQTMTGVYAQWWGKKNRRYTCHKGYQGAKHISCSPCKMILAEPVEQAVWEQVKDWLRDPDALADEAYISSPRLEDCLKELERTEKHLAEVEKGRESVLDALASGLFELDARTKAKLADLKRRKERLEQRKKELLFMARGVSGATARIDELRALADEVLEHIDQLGFTDKKALVRSLVTQVTVSGRGKCGRNGLADIAITIAAKMPEQVESAGMIENVKIR
jgi:site-specific DNA recombinase